MNLADLTAQVRNARLTARGEAWLEGYEQGRRDAAKDVERVPIFTMLVVNRFDAVSAARGEGIRPRIDVRPD